MHSVKIADHNAFYTHFTSEWPLFCHQSIINGNNCAEMSPSVGSYNFGMIIVNFAIRYTACDAAMQIIHRPLIKRY